MSFPRVTGWRAQWLLACAVVAMLASGVGCSSHPEATYQGRRTSQWIGDLRSRDVSRQIRACQALRALGPTAHSAAPRLAELLATSSNRGLSAEAGVTLAMIGPAATRPMLDHIRDARQLERVVGVLRYFNSNASPFVMPLVDVLEHPKGRPIQLAQTGLRDLACAGDREVVPIMLRELQNERLHECARLSLGAALSNIGADSVSSVLVVLLDSPDLITRRAAMEGLVHGETAPLSPMAQRALLLRTQDPDPPTRIMLARALAECTGPEADEAMVVAFLRLAEDPVPEVRYAVGRALFRASMKSRRPRPDLVQALARLRNDPELATYWAKTFPELGDMKPYFY